MDELTKILVISNDNEIVEDITGVLHTETYDIASALSSKEAVDIVKRRQPDLILLMADHVDEDPHELCHQLRSSKIHVAPFVVLIAENGTSPDTKMDAYRGIVDESMAWPIPNQAFLSWIACVIRLKRTLEREDAEGQRFQNLVEKAFDGTAIHCDGKIVYINQSGAEILGADYPDQVIGMSVDDIVHQDFKKIVRTRLQQVHEEGVVSPIEQKIIRSDGETIEIELMGVSTTFDGKPAVQVMFRDITERSKAFAALTESEEKFRALAERSPNMIFINSGSRVVYVNQRCEDVMGYTRAEFLAREFDFFDLIAPESKELIKRNFAIHLEGKNIPPYDYSLITKDGKILDAIISTELMNCMGEDAILGIITDITERKRVEKALSDSEARYRSVVEDMPVLVCRFQPDGNLTYVNKNYGSYFNRKPEELVGYNFFNFIPEEDRDRVQDHYSSLTLEKPVTTYEHKVLAPDGTERWQRWTDRALFDEDGCPVEYQSIGEDITESREAEERLRNTTTLLETIFDTTDLELAYLDPDYNFLRVNDTFARAEGREPTEFQGENFFKIYPETGKQEIFQGVIESGFPYRAYADDFRKTQESQDTRDFYDWSIVPTKNEEGIVDGLVLTLSRVTERVKAEEELWETTRLIETIVDHTPLLMAFLDPQFNFIRVNKAYASADEREPSYFPGKNHFNLYPNEENESIFRRVVETGEPYFTYAKPFEYAEHPERGVSYWDWSLTPILDGSGVVTGLVLTLADVTDRIEAEEARQQSEQKYRDLVENISDVIYSTDHTGVVTYVSPAIESFLGFHPSEIIGKNFNEFMDSEDIDRLRENFSRIMAGEVTGNRYRITTKSGDVRWMYTSSKPIMEDGDVTGVQGVMTDITERMHAQRALEEQLNFLQTLLDTIPNPIFYKDADGCYTGGNQAFEEFLGVPESEFVGKTVYDISPKEIADTYFAKDKELFENPGSQRYEWKVQREGGEMRDVIFDKATLLDSEGHVNGIIGIISDITERKRAEEALRESEKKFRSIIEQSDDAIVLSDQNGKIIEWNQSAEGIVGLKKEDVLGRDLWDVQIEVAPEIRRTPGRTQEIRNVLTDYFKTAEAPWLDELRENEIVRPDGSRAFIQASIFPIETEEGLLAGSIIRDITGRKEIEEALRLSEERFRKVFEDGPLGMAIIDKERRFVGVNEMLCEIMGVPERWLLNRTVSESVPEEYATAYVDNLDKLYRGEIPTYKAEQSFQRRRKRLVWVSLFVTAVRDENGEFLYYLAMVEDITSRKETEDEIRKLSRAVEQSSVAVIIADAGGNIEYVNPMFEDLTEYSSEEAINKKPSILKSGYHSTAFYSLLWETITSGEEWRGEFLNRKKSGTLYWESASISPIRNTEGEITHYVAIKEDITERKASERALLESEERYRSLTDDVIDSSAVGVCILDAKFNIVWVNRAYEEFFSVDREQLIGKATRSLVRERIMDTVEDPEGFADKILATYDDNRPLESFECHVIPENGREERWLEHRSHPIRSGLFSGGRIEHYYDITASKESEEALQQRTRDLSKRVMELNCLFHISNLIERRDITLAEIFDGTVAVIPSGFQYPELTCSRLVLDGVEYKTQNFRETAWSLKSDIFVREKKVGYLEVCYFEELGHKVEGPFLFEERQLINAIAERMGRVYESMQANEALQKAHDELSILMAVSKDVVSTLELEPLLNLVLEKVKTVMDYDNATVLTRSGETMMVKAYQGPTVPVDMQSLEFTAEDHPLIQVMLDARRPIYFRDIRESQELMDVIGRISSIAIPRMSEGFSWLGVPLVSKDNVIGTLSIVHNHPEYFKGEFLDLVQSLANQVAVAIDNAQLYQQAQEAAIDAERSRIARDLHDAVTQTLFSASLIAEALPDALEQSPDRGRKGLHELRRLTRGALAEMRTLLVELRPSALTEKSLGEILRPLCEAVTSRAGIPVHFEVLADSALPTDLQVTLYRITQEALNNVAKHSEASEVQVSLSSKENSGQLLIIDDGVGFITEQEFPGSLGIGIMRERAERSGITLKIDSKPKQGTQVFIDW
ncbi:MAG: PAS domain S-box protein [Anaerolineales bacterium]|nr:PAS domain S-box protein [Anaerolineales bacterium]